MSREQPRIHALIRILIISKDGNKKIGVFILFFSTCLLEMGGVNCRPRKR